MPNLEASFRALRVLHAAKDLFTQHGFYIGIDRIVSEARRELGFYIKNYILTKNFIFLLSLIKIIVLCEINNFLI